jgi:hypothetical protein
VAVLVVPRPATIYDDETGRQIHAAIAELPIPSAPILLRFSPNDQWIQTVGVALALERRGIRFEVDPAWAFMFGADHVYAPTDEVVVWHLRTPQPGDRRLSDKVAIAAN